MGSGPHLTRSALKLLNGVGGPSRVDHEGVKGVSF